MSSAGPSPTSRPSVFLSYASENRAAARMLRDTLQAAGLDVWYDESELGGGDAWDQKIRRQIRDCDYFMPVISATTERRKEGYFRREWRLAAERTLDMADDVLFLLPVVIDDTSEAGARVPEKFFTVQWLRAPGGASTPALHALVQRLVAGEHTVAPRPPLVERPRLRSTAAPPAPPVVPAAAAKSSDLPPAMPPFPPAPETGRVGHWLKYGAEIAWWVITAAWLLFSRLPRWLRIVIAIWFVITLVSTCGRDDPSKSRPPRPEPSENVDFDVKQLETTAGDTVQKIGAAIEHAIKEASDRKAAEKAPARKSEPPSTAPTSPNGAATPAPTEPAPPPK